MSWTPANLPNLAAWWSGGVVLNGSDVAAADGEGVKTWTDQSGNAKHATQATAGARPTLRATGGPGNTPALEFDGGDLLVTPNISLGAFTLVFIWKASAAGLLFEQSVDAGSNPGAYTYPSVGNTLTVGRGGAFTTKNLSADWGVGGSWRIGIHRYDGTHAGNTLEVNGVTQSLTSGSLTADPGTGVVTDACYLGARTGVVAPLTGFLAEMVLYNAALDAPSLLNMRKYLNRKYALYPGDTAFRSPLDSPLIR